MSDVQVTQEDRDAAANYIEPLNGHILAANIRLGLVDGHMAVQAFARHRLATRPAPAGEPVAWMYAHPKFGCYTDIKRRFTHPGWTETPLYTCPALDVDGLVEKVARAIHDTIENDDDSGGGGYLRAARACLAAIKDATDAGA